MEQAEKVLHFYVKIRQGKMQALAETKYYRNGMNPEFFFRWKWYFQYREALLRTQQPRYFTELSYGTYVPDPRTVHETLRQRLANRIKAKKGKITAGKNKLREVKEKWTSLFPIEEDPAYKEGMRTIDRLTKDLERMQHDYQEYAT